MLIESTHPKPHKNNRSEISANTLMSCLVKRSFCINELTSGKIHPFCAQEGNSVIACGRTKRKSKVRYAGCLEKRTCLNFKHGN